MKVCLREQGGLVSRAGVGTASPTEDTSKAINVLIKSLIKKGSDLQPQEPGSHARVVLLWKGLSGDSHDSQWAETREAMEMRRATKEPFNRPPY